MKCCCCITDLHDLNGILLFCWYLNSKYLQYEYTFCSHDSFSWILIWNYEKSFWLSPKLTLFSKYIHILRSQQATIWWDSFLKRFFVDYMAHFLTIDLCLIEQNNSLNTRFVELQQRLRRYFFYSIKVYICKYPPPT